jgi:hypothetical protein
MVQFDSASKKIKIKSNHSYLQAKKAFRASDKCKISFFKPNWIAQQDGQEASFALL